MTCEEYIPEWRTAEELTKVQENLSETDFDIFLKQLKAFHWLQIFESFDDVPVTDPRGYSLDNND